MKTKNTPVPNNYSLFGVNYSDNCRTTRQLLAFLGKLLVFTFNYSFFQISQKVSDDPSTIRNWTQLPDIGSQLVAKTAN